MLLNSRFLEKYLEEDRFVEFGILLSPDSGFEIFIIPELVIDYSFKEESQEKHIQFEVLKKDIPIKVLKDLYSSQFHLILGKLDDGGQVFFTCIFTDFENDPTKCTITFRIGDIYQKKQEKNFSL